MSDVNDVSDVYRSKILSIAWSFGPDLHWYGSYLGFKKYGYGCLILMQNN